MKHATLSIKPYGTFRPFERSGVQFNYTEDFELHQMRIRMIKVLRRLQADPRARIDAVDKVRAFLDRIEEEREHRLYDVHEF